MSKYRRRIVEVEAWQNDDAGPAMPYWLSQVAERKPGGNIVIHLGGDENVVAHLGDYVVLHPDGRIGVRDAGAFAVEFEAVPHG